MTIDPSLARKQLEWSENIGRIRLTDYSNQGQNIFARVTDHFGLAGLWLMDAFAARSVDFPQNDFELICYKIGRSNLLRYLYNGACIAQIILPFFATPGCEFTSGLDRLSKFIVTDVICLLVYLFDLAMVYSVNSEHKHILHKPWSTFRLICCFLLLLDCIGFAVADLVGFRVVRCIFPLFLISRRTNLQKMLQGLMTSGLRSITVVIALAHILLLLSFVGFLIFRDIDPGNGGLQRFDSFPQAMFATLHCFTSRPFCLLAMKPYFDVNSGSAFFFVAVTLAADILCIGLIVAIGTAEYKIFAADFVKRRYASRALTTRIVFDAFAVNSKIDRKTWISLCQNMQGDYYRGGNEASILFSLENSQESGKLEFDGFLRLCALLAQRVVVNTSSTENNMSESCRSSLSSCRSSDGDAFGAGSRVSVGLLEALTAPEVRLNEDGVIPSGRSSYVSIKSRYYGSRKWDRRSFGNSEKLNRIAQNVSNICYLLVTATVSIQIPGFNNATASIRHVFLSLLYLLLVIYLVGLSSNGADVGWFQFGFFIESMFWLDMSLLLGAFGVYVVWGHFLNRLNLVVNIASLVALCVLGTNQQGDSKTSTIIAVLLIQSTRLLNPFFVINDLSIFEKILPILLRSAFIYFSVIYFFAIFAHQFFCGDLNVDLASEGDDDSVNWVKFSGMLNFDTFLQSLFTMFEISVLANWSIVMDAAAKVAKTKAYIFFYLFRLVVTLNVLPLLLGFIMQAFLAARKEQALQLKLRKQEEYEDNLQNQEPNVISNAARISSVNSTSGGIILSDIRLQQQQQGEATNFEQTDLDPPCPSTDKKDPNTRVETMASEIVSRKIGFGNVFSPVTITTQARSTEGQRYAVSSGARTKSTSRLSLWNAESAQMPGTSRKSIAPLSSDLDKDRIIEELRAELASSSAQLSIVLSKMGSPN